MDPTEALDNWPGDSDLQAVSRLPKLYPEDGRHGAETFLPRYILGLVWPKNGQSQQSLVQDRIFLGSYAGNHLVLRQKTRTAEDEFKWEDLGFKFEITDLEAAS